MPLQLQLQLQFVADNVVVVASISSLPRAAPTRASTCEVHVTMRAAAAAAVPVGTGLPGGVGDGGGTCPHLCPVPRSKGALRVRACVHCTMSCSWTEYYDLC